MHKAIQFLKNVKGINRLTSSTKSSSKSAADVPAKGPPRLKPPLEATPPRRIVEPEAVDQTSDPATDAREDPGDSRPSRLAADVEPLCDRRFVGPEIDAVVVV